MENSPTRPATEPASAGTGYSLLALLFLIATAGVLLALVRSAFNNVGQKLDWPDAMTIFNLAVGVHLGLVVGAIFGFLQLRTFFGIVVGSGTGATVGAICGWVLVAGANGRVYLGGALFLLLVAALLAKLVTRVERT